MNVNIQTVHFDADPKLKSYIEKETFKVISGSMTGLRKSRCVPLNFDSS
jgi:hypothetical protein